MKWEVGHSVIAQYMEGHIRCYPETYAIVEAHRCKRPGIAEARRCRGPSLKRLVIAEGCQSRIPSSRRPIRQEGFFFSEAHPQGGPSVKRHVAQNTKLVGNGGTCGCEVMLLFQLKVAREACHDWK